MAAVCAIPPDLAAALEALDRFAPEASRRAAGALEMILERWHSTRDGPYGGKLTGDGFPVELVFSSLDPGVRYTCDVAGPGLAPATRLEAGGELLRALGRTSRFPLQRLQQAGAGLSWGAWLGGRHTAGSDRYKLYVEAPENLLPAAREELRQVLGVYGTLLDSHAFTLRIAGWDTGSGRLEFYFRGQGLEPRALSGLLRFSGLSRQEEDLFCLLEEASRQPARVRLPGAQHGFSISLRPGGEIEAFAFFAFARSLFGSDAAARSALLALADRRAWNLEQYAAVSAPLADRRGKQPCHGIVSFVLRGDGLPGVAVGVRPWWGQG